jgi:hypothetical protein
MQAFQKTSKLLMNYNFGKKYLCRISISGGAAGEWLITDEFSTYLDKMDIFVISKDQTFRICATFLDPAKFFILVIHLVVICIKKIKNLLIKIDVQPRVQQWKSDTLFSKIFDSKTEFQVLANISTTRYFLHDNLYFNVNQKLSNIFIGSHSVASQSIKNLSMPFNELQKHKLSSYVWEKNLKLIVKQNEKK